MNRNLIDYLPPVLRNVKQYKAILGSSEQLEFTLLWDEADNVFGNQYVLYTDANGVERWETLLSIKPKGTDTLSDRRFRILARLNERLPYTFPVLTNMLKTLCGEGNYTVSLDYNAYLLSVRVGLAAKSNYDDVKTLLNKIVPANLIIDLALLYNQHLTLAPYTHEHLRAYTHDQLRNEVIN